MTTQRDWCLFIVAPLSHRVITINQRSRVRLFCPQSGSHSQYPYLNSLPRLPGLHSLIEGVLDGAHDADVVVYQLAQEVEVVLGLLLVHLLHLLLHVGELLQRGRQLGVVLGAAQESQALAELICLSRETFPGIEFNNI